MKMDFSMAFYSDSSRVGHWVYDWVDNLVDRLVSRVVSLMGETMAAKFVS